MKKAIYTFIASSLLLAGCGKEKPAPLGNLGEPSLSDSLIYYYGLLEGESYLSDAKSDTTLLSYESRQRYLKGLRDGLRAVEEANDTYNQGLQTGIELALSLYGYNRKYGIDLNKELLYKSIAYKLESDSTPSLAESMAEFHRIVEKLDFNKREEMVKEMHLSLAQEGARLKMKKLSDDLYVMDSKTGTGDSIRRGDLVFATLNYVLENGRNLEMPAAQQLTVGGPTMPDVMIRVYTRMKKGGAAQYATTADALFGSHAYQLGLQPQEVVLMSVTINNVENPDSVGKGQMIAI